MLRTKNPVLMVPPDFSRAVQYSVCRLSKNITVRLLDFREVSVSTPRACIDLSFAYELRMQPIIPDAPIPIHSFSPNFLLRVSENARNHLSLSHNVPEYSPSPRDTTTRLCRILSRPVSRFASRSRLLHVDAPTSRGPLARRGKTTRCRGVNVAAHA